MKVGIISQWYEPETGSAAHPTAIARALRDRGHSMRVLTSFPSYPQGRVYPGYRMRPRQHEHRDGIDLLRVPDLPSHDTSAVRRAASLTSFAASATVQATWLRGADACLVYLTPATVGVAAMALRALSGVPYVLYVQDLWPETVTASGFIGSSRVTETVERALTAYLARLYRGAAGIAAISPTMASTITERSPGVPAVSVPNWVDEDLFTPRPSARPTQLGLDRTWVMYAGGVGEVQALDHAVRAMALLRERPDIGLAVVGDGVARPGLEALTAELGLRDAVRFVGPRPMEDMPGLMAESAAQLVSLRDLPVFSGTIPSKLQASMASGVPVVCALAGDAAELVDRTGCGVAVPPEDPQALAAAFRQVADLTPEQREAMGRRGRDAYLTEMGAGAGGARLERLLLDAAATRPR